MARKSKAKQAAEKKRGGGKERAARAAGLTGGARPLPNPVSVPAEIRNREVELSLRRAEAEKQAHPERFWPQEQELPQHHVKRSPPPCPRCRRIYRNDGSQAAVCCSTGAEIAFFRCRDCGHRWQMPVKKEY